MVVILTKFAALANLESQRPCDPVFRGDTRGRSLAVPWLWRQLSALARMPMRLRFTNGCA